MFSSADGRTAWHERCGGALEQIARDLAERAFVLSEEGGYGAGSDLEGRQRYLLAREWVQTLGRGVSQYTPMAHGGSKGSEFDNAVPGCDLDASVRRDLHIATAAYEALSRGDVVLRRRPIRGLGDPTKVLYLECETHLSFKSSDGPFRSADIFSAMERLGLTNRIDCHVVEMAIASLASNPDLALGVNISGKSAVETKWWEPLFISLEKFPDVACRLTIEISERAKCVPNHTRRFRNRLRHLKCRVAIDDFGAGFGLSSSIELREPDIVKIDSSILRRASETGVRRLRGLVRLASELASIVVVDGVESEMDLHMAGEAGAHWIQGGLFRLSVRHPDIDPRRVLRRREEGICKLKGRARMRCCARGCFTSCRRARSGCCRSLRADSCWTMWMVPIAAV
ncbi:EAL domain-containing protein [Burkholderia cenocepacia]|uniref:EAL domain-containing protein n=1 Tax=Burkholderia cenocepacia TaxID=95486 RepID=UPI001908EB03|nr:EAL domain-containing protein [Burkholderia cenocepacia]MBJ9923947.1 EAL domain-containing protein [Burkholderia cenocepacia]